MDELFLNRMKNLLNDDYPLFIEAIKNKPVKALYLNNLKAPLDFLERKFDLKKHHFVDGGFYYDDYKYPLGKHCYFDCGLYYIQEPSAMIVASLLDIQEGDFVLDMCAAPGGKACFVASRLNQTGLVIANDISHSRASILSSNIERLGLTNTIVTSAKPSVITSQLPNYFDKIILDAPCSGEGMFRKLNQAIETWSYDKVLECAKIQKELVDEAYKALKPGGELVYSTCTYAIEENEDIVDYLLNKYPDMNLVQIPLSNGMSQGIHHPECVRLYPHLHLGEGHFIALFKKQPSLYSSHNETLKPNITKNQMALLNEFYEKYLTIFPSKNIINSNNHLYQIQSYFPKLEKVKILRTGLYLGECKKNRFEPSYSLSHTLNQNDVKNYYNFSASSIEVEKYLKGETLAGTSQKGYGLLLVDGFALSFYKESNGIIKNLIPKGLRKLY